MKNNLATFLILIPLSLLALLLRFSSITKNPISLNIDEVSYGYSAYSILKTGRDENGVFMPLSFRSIGDYKNPVLIYSLVPSIATFGLNEFGVRFTTALFGTLSIPVIFFLISSLIENRRVAFLAAALLTVSPWHIYYSRFASESLVGLFFLMLGVWFFLKIQYSRIWIFLSSLALALSIYSYHSLRLFIPLLMSYLVLVELKRNKANRTNLIVFVLLSIVLVLPLLYFVLFGSANTRAGMVFLAQDIDYTRYVILDHIQRSGENLLLLFFWIKRYLNYFQPDFLFFNGLNMTTTGTLGLGVLYLFELPWFILGIVEIIKVKIINKGFIYIWILLGIIPASLTNNEQSSVRSLIILPMLLLIVSLGAWRFFQLINKIKSSYIKLGIFGAYAFFISIILIQTYLVFSIHFPIQRGEAFMEGTKETVLYALANQDKYKEIVYDPYRGIESPYIVNIPYMYILFYSKYNPALFQNENKRYGVELFGFDKYTTRRIDWRGDRFKTDTLFIGSPWSLPEKDIKKDEILRKIYLSGGQLAFLIVSPK